VDRLLNALTVEADYLNTIHLMEHITDHMAAELGERFRLPVWVRNLVRAGKAGRESGRGFATMDIKRIHRGLN
jgi:3-hydroxyacyl-CoA dehydrogenase